MNYVKSLFYNFLIVFFADALLPGIEVMDPTKLPRIGGDLLFAIVLGLLNSLICPILKTNERYLTASRLGIIALILNFAAYAFLKILPLGIHVMTVEGYLLVACAVTVGSFALNFLEMKHLKQKPPSSSDLPGSNPPPSHPHV